MKHLLFQAIIPTLVQHRECGISLFPPKHKLQALLLRLDINCKYSGRTKKNNE